MIEVFQYKGNCLAKKKKKGNFLFIYVLIAIWFELTLLFITVQLIFNQNN